jgi:hypothetical protein
MEIKQRGSEEASIHLKKNIEKGKASCSFFDNEERRYKN